MKNQFKIIIGAAAICISQLGFSQEIDPGATGFFLDADNIARRHFGGTARTMGYAGAQTALGGDLSSITVNPAGIGVFRSSDFSATAGIQLNSTTTQFSSGFDNRSTVDNIDNFHVGNIGVVIAQSDDSEYSDWKSEGIAINYSRLSNYHTRFNFKSEGSTFNFRDYIYDISNGIPPSLIDSDNFSPLTLNEDLVAKAYDVFILNDLRDYDNDVWIDDYGVINAREASNHEGEVTITGGQSQWDIGYGANYQDKVYIGAGMGIATYKQNVTTIFKEELASTTNTSSAELRDITYSTEERTRGTGLNFKAGVIARPSDIVRVGLSVETPTFYRASSEYNTRIDASYNGGEADVYGDNGSLEVQTLNSYTGIEGTTFEDKFSVRSPYRFNTGIALFAGKKGFLSIDAEYVMYNRTRISKLNGLSAFEDNNTLKSVYQNVFNLRVGGEARMDDFRLRAGYALYPNTVRSGVRLPSTQKQFITAGAGYHFEGNYFDIAVVYANQESDYTAYPGMNGTITNEHQDVSVMFTYGFRF